MHVYMCIFFKIYILLKKNIFLNIYFLKKLFFWRISLGYCLTILVSSRILELLFSSFSSFTIFIIRVSFNFNFICIYHCFILFMFSIYFYYSTPSNRMVSLIVWSSCRIEIIEKEREIKRNKALGAFY